MEYVVSAFYDESKGSGYKKNLFGLFDAKNWSGEGNFCGWYSSEYYNNTNLLAYFVNEGDIVNPDYPRITPLTVCNQHYDTVSIFSGMAEYTFDAETLEEALEIFDKGLYVNMPKKSWMDAIPFQFEELPQFVRYKVLDLLRSYSKCEVYFCGDHYEYQVGICVDPNKYANCDLKGTCYADKIYTQEELIANYIEEYLTYPVQYKGKEDAWLLYRLKELKDMGKIGKVKIDVDGNAHLGDVFDLYPRKEELLAVSNDDYSYASKIVGRGLTNMEEYYNHLVIELPWGQNMNREMLALFAYLRDSGRNEFYSVERGSATLDQILVMESMGARASVTQLYKKDCTGEIRITALQIKIH